MTIDFSQLARSDHMGMHNKRNANAKICLKIANWSHGNAISGELPEKDIIA